MSHGEEREARSVALEKTYVHQVYQQISAAQYQQTQKQSRSWPRVKQFLEDLEPGSLVCDVGCGNGKYLNVNPFIYQLGVDRCAQLTEAAREKENEVLVCDNLALPFRDDSFDAVLSIAVVHHFATTERRVGALRELARVLRIGGRLVISVWAMEQRHRKFESQDVLVPWHRPQHLSTPSLELTSTTTTTSEEDGPPPYHAYTQTSDSDSCRAGGSGQRKRGRSRHKGRSIDPTKPPTSSPSSSSLSSPNETCYSFVRRALQKLAGGKRGGSRHRPWFLDSWTSCAKEPPSHRYDPEGCEDIHNLPIELRRLEEEQEAPQRRQTFACSHQLSDAPLNHKSKSLTDIITVEQRAIVRSRSSVPSLEVSPPEEPEDSIHTECSVTGAKPKLVKQKQSVCDDDLYGEDGDEPTDMRDLVKALPEFKISGYGGVKRGNVFKQSSMNEELMSTERLREKERVRQNIQKQASLNEDLMFRRNRTLDSLRDTLFSASTAKRFQLLKNGLSNKIKSSTTNIEKVAGASFKNGFVRILQGWTGQDVGAPIPQPAPPPHTPAADSKNLVVDEKNETERRHSREDGSDSSKDSSLQSDTSVDSEDSFASVIFVPKPEPPPEQTSNNTSPTLQSNPASPGPTSPKVKLPPPISPKLKQPPQISFGMSSHPSSPKLKHPGALLGSPTPGSPKIKFFSQPTSPRPYQTSFLISPTSKSTFKLQASPNGSNTSSPTCKSFTFINPSTSKVTPPVPFNVPNIGHITPTSPTADQPRVNETSPAISPTKSSAVPTVPSPKDGKTASLTSPKEETKASTFLDLWPSLSPGVSPTSPIKDSTKRLLQDVDSEKPTVDKSSDKLKKIQEIIKQKDKPSTSRSQSQFPLVRRSVTVSSTRSGADTPPTRPLPRLMSLELFNPETDDMDSDSSPDSVGSVISVLNDDEHTSQDHSDSTKLGEGASSDVIEPTPSTSELKPSCLPVISTQEKIRLEVEEAQIETVHSPRVSPSQSLLEAAADVASSLEETVDAVIQSSPRAKRKQLKLFENTDPLIVLQDDLVPRRSPKFAGRERSDDSPSLLEESFKRKAQDRWSLQPESSIPFVPLDSSKASSLGAIPKVRTNQPSEEVIKEKDSWDEECRQHLADFAEKLSEKLLAEIDRYREQSSLPSMSIEDTDLPSGIQDMNDPYLSRLSEELHDLKTLSLELHESHSFVNKLWNTNTLENSVARPSVNIEDRVCEKEVPIEEQPENNESVEAENSPICEENTKLIVDQMNSSNLNLEQSVRIDIVQTEPSMETESQENVASSVSSNKVKLKSDEVVVRPVDNQEIVTIITENVVDQKSDVRIELSDAESSASSDNSWADSRRNTILHSDKHLQLARGDNPDLKPSTSSYSEDVTRIEILPGSEVPRRPSISIETSDRVDKVSAREIFDSGQLRPNISVESSDAGDISERTASSSDGSRSGSRRDTIQICDSGSVLSLRPGTSLESSDAGDVSERTGSGSEGSRAGDSRRNTISIGDHTSGSQASLLRPEISLESSDCGDVSERTGSSDCSRADSRRDTSSAGKTASTASLASDRASDKDATYADRRIARCDGRSSSEETAPQRRGCMNKLVRQRASTQEPPETLTKTESCETSLSGSTSQESLMSDSGGGAITFHRYYHVFREGELDQLIERYVENLHIISSYYDHANWCVIAEKVHVWTI